LIIFVLLFVLLSGAVNLGSFFFMGIELEIQNIYRDLGIILLGMFSIYLTPPGNRKLNDFSWTPVMKVAKLFAAIFVTIIPAILILKAGERGAMAGLLSLISEPSHYFWVCGCLSSFLDNTPAYLTLFNAGLGMLGMEEAAVAAACTAASPQCNEQWTAILTAVSAGSVFMGANSYVGNAPNFMVKSISEEAGVNMPGFFGYIFKYSVPFLIPVFILNTLVYF
jgi:Na+/H+ antiporter NhaD/arsenite permease-like protein